MNTALNIIPQDLTGADLVDWFEAHNDGVESGQYFRKFSQDELIAAREKFTDQSIKFFRESELTADQIKELKESLKQKGTELKELLDTISVGGTTENGRIYYIKDYDERMVYKYNQSGELISKRNMLPEERQVQLKALK